MGPFDGAEKLEMNTEYHATNLPYQFNVKLKINSDIYKIDGILSGKEFKVGFIMNENTTLIHLLWRIEKNSGKLEIKLISPFSSIDNINTIVMYDFNEKNISVKQMIGNKEISITGKIKDQHIIIDGNTPFMGWKVFKASIYWDFSTSTKSAKINVYQNENDYLLRFEASFNAEKGLFKVETPIPGYENIEAGYVLDSSTYTSDILVTIKTPLYKIIEINA